MEYFRSDNTDGFTADELRSMNAAHRELLADYTEDDEDIDRQIAQQIGDDICDAIATVGAGGWGGAADIVAHVRTQREIWADTFPASER